MSKHQWQGKPIVALDHHHDLERESASLEFGASRLDRKKAEDAAYDSYKRTQHTAAIGHHLSALRCAHAAGKRDVAEQHNALYSMHMKAMGMKASGSPPPALDKVHAFEATDKFKPHPADQLLVSNSMEKSERESFFKNVDSDAVFLSEPDSDESLSKALRSPVSLDQLHGQRVRVYFNLHNRLFSVMHKGRVVAHVPEVSLGEANFKVSEAGRQRVLREQRKNVHAFVEGTFQHLPDGGHQTHATAVKYNPYKYSTFVRAKDESPIASAKLATLKNVPHPLITVHEEPHDGSPVDPSWLHQRKQNG